METYKRVYRGDNIEFEYYPTKAVLLAMREYARDQVRLALEAASKSAAGYIYVEGTPYQEELYSNLPECVRVGIIESSILEAYPQSNIK